MAGQNDPEMRRLNEQIRHLEMDLDSRRKLISQLLHGKSSLVTENKGLKAQIEGLEAQVEVQNESEKKLRAELEAQKQTNKEGQTGPEFQTVQKLQNELEAHKKLQSNYWGMSGEVIKEMKQDAVDMKNEIKELKESMEKSQQSAVSTTSLQEEIAKLKLAENDYKQQIEEMKIKDIRVTAITELKEQQAFNVRTQLSILTDDTKKKDFENFKKMTEMEHLLLAEKKRAKKYRDGYLQKTQEAEEKEKKLAETSDELAQMREKWLWLADIKTKGELAEYDQKMAEKKQELAEKERKSVEMEQKMAGKEEELAEKEQTLDEKEKKMDEKEQNLAEKEQELAETLEKLAKSTENVVETRKDLIKTTDKLADTTLNLLKATEELAQQDRKIEELMDVIRVKDGVINNMHEEEDADYDPFIFE